MSIDNGGSAFPRNIVLQGDDVLNAAESFGEEDPGMTLRDYFAAKAMQGMVTRIGRHDADLIAHDAYIMADALLAARGKSHE